MGFDFFVDRNCISVNYASVVVVYVHVNCSVER
jgi:hypothetical protein